MTDPGTFSISQIQLDKIKVATHQRISSVVFHDLNISSHEDFITRDMVLAMEAYILGKKQQAEQETLTYTVVFTRPASWWQHFKQSAIENGNPFFDSAKVRIVEERRRVEAVVTRHRAIVWPEWNIALPPEAGQSVTLALPSTADWRSSR